MHTATVSIVRAGRVEYKTVQYSPEDAKARLKYLYGFHDKITSVRRNMIEAKARYV
jgi:hypothetical protein